MAVQSTWIKNSDGSAWTVGTSPNSCRIVYPAAATLADLQDTIENFITNHGWALYNSTFGTNAKGYRALNYDGTTYKYMVLDFNTSGYMMAKTYESFNTSGSSYTNLAYTSDYYTYGQRVDLTNGGDMYIACQNRYACFESSTSAGIGSSIGNAWSGVFETARDNPEDTGVYPCHFWASGQFYCSSVSNSGSVSYPKLVFGLTASNAQKHSSNISDFGMVGNNLTSSTTVDTMTQFYAKPNYWSTKEWVTDSKLFVTSISYDLASMGRVRWLKMVSSGGLMDEATIKVDTDGFLDAVGTDTTFICFTNSVGRPVYLPK